MVLANSKGGNKHSYFFLITIPIYIILSILNAYVLVQGESRYNQWYVLFSDKKVEKMIFIILMCIIFYRKKEFPSSVVSNDGV